MGNYLKRISSSKGLPKTFLYSNSNPFLYPMMIFYLYVLTEELSDRNLFFWGAGLCGTLGYFINIYTFIFTKISFKLLTCTRYVQGENF